MKISSAFKVGVLTLVALCILVFTLMWVKGRSLSTGERYTIQFKDVNGIREGSGVQMMGLRIGQIEQITPIIDGEESYVELKFVITEPGITIPRASTISIQQSGIIGEQFLEIAPPKAKTIYIPVCDNSLTPKNGDKVQMLLSKEFYEVGYIKSVDTVETATLALPLQSSIKTKYTYKISYVIDLPGLILPEMLSGKLEKKNEEIKLSIRPFQNIDIPYPEIGLQYTVIEPMRLADFMNLQFKSAASLNETNERIAAILTDDVIADLKDTAENLNKLVQKSGTTVDKAEKLIEASQQDLDYITTSINNVAEQIVLLTENLNELVTDKNFKETFQNTADSVNRLTANLNRILEDDLTSDMMINLNETLKNASEISAYVNQFTKDEDVKVDLKDAIKKMNCALDELAITLDAVNEIATEDKDKIRLTIKETSEASKNLKKFSEKLNKRFLLFRLMF